MKEKGFQLNWISRYRDELYGIAILTVLFFHFTLLHVGFYEESSSLTFKLTRIFYEYFGSSGVDMFVFMSGMGLYYSFSKNNDIGRFYGRRFRRILIPYIIVGGAFWIRVDLFHRAAGFARFLKDFFYVTFVTEGVNSLWFVAFIGAMYLAFPWLYKTAFKMRFGKAVVLLILIISIIVPFFLEADHHDLYKNIDEALTRIPVFIVGMMAGKYIKENRAVPHITAILLSMACFYGKYYVMLHGIKGVPKRYAATLMALGAIILFTYLLRLCEGAKIIKKVLCFFGKHSLELYLLHIMMWEFMGEAGIPIHRASRYAVLVVASCLLAPLLGKATSIISGLMTGQYKKAALESNT